MSERKWTPGPWEVCAEPAPNGAWFSGVTIGAASDSDARRVCDVFTAGAYGDEIGDMHRANARLIAAAPELYEALEVALVVMIAGAELKHGKGWEAQENSPIAMARAALATANRGEGAK